MAMGDQKRRCVFCFHESGDQVKLSREHLLSRPVASAFGIERESPVARIDWQDGKVLWARLNGIQQRCVCTECNNGWMNRLEHSMADIARWISGPNHDPLGVERERIVRTWALKTHILLCFIEGNAGRFDDESFQGECVVPPVTLAKAVFNGEIDEDAVDKLELEIDNECLNLFALYQPQATDLRTILMILKINNDLERIGDLAFNIFQSVLYLIERPEIKVKTKLPIMSEYTKGMLKDCINSFINGDSKLARDIFSRDDQVDEAGDNILVQMLEIMKEDGSTAERCLHVLRISKNLERIADMSTNIAEDVVFMIDGEVLKKNYK